MPKQDKIIIIYLDMKKYILLLFSFIVLYVCAMGLVQEYTPINSMGKPAKVMFAEAHTYKPTRAAAAPTPKALTEEEQEALRKEREKARMGMELEKARKFQEEESLRLKEEQQKKEQEVADAKFKQKNLVNVETLAENSQLRIFLDIRYATENNFTGNPLYKSDKCYLQEDTAAALMNAAKYALEEDTPFYLCLYDCYRPRSAQQALWDIYPVPGQVANPKTGSNHNRGTAVDLGPCDEEGYPLPTPTDFDDFTPKAYAYAQEGIPEDAINNRKALQKVMRKAGFTTIRKEWWHFNYKDAKKYPLTDLEF